MKRILICMTPKSQLTYEFMLLKSLRQTNIIEIIESVNTRLERVEIFFVNK